MTAENEKYVKNMKPQACILFKQTGKSLNTIYTAVAHLNIGLVGGITNVLNDHPRNFPTFNKSANFETTPYAQNKIIYRVTIHILRFVWTNCTAKIQN